MIDVHGSMVYMIYCVCISYNILYVYVFYTCLHEKSDVYVTYVLLISYSLLETSGCKHKRLGHCSSLFFLWMQHQTHTQTPSVVTVGSRMF